MIIEVNRLKINKWKITDNIQSFIPKTHFGKS